jgi:molecular chaperone HtpG
MKTEPGKHLSLAQYVEAMPPEQKEIYYLIGEDRELLAHSPYLERFRARGQDVLLLTDPVDEFMMPSLYEFQGKPVKPIDQGEVADEKEDEARKEAGEKFKGLLEALKASLAEEVSDVRLSARLTESAACLVAGAGGMTAHMERLLQKLGQGEAPRAKRILELNADHAVVQALHRLHEKNPQDPRIGEYARILLDQALLAEGSRIHDPVAFARRINELMVKGVEGGS